MFFYEFLLVKVNRDSFICGKCLISHTVEFYFFLTYKFLYYFSSLSCPCCFSSKIYYLMVIISGSAVGIFSVWKKTKNSNYAYYLVTSLLSPWLPDASVSQGSVGVGE